MKLKACDVVGMVVLLQSSGNRLEPYNVHASSPNGSAIMVSCGKYGGDKWWVGSRRFLADVADVVGEIAEEKP